MKEETPVVWITGGGSGLGSAMARVFSEQGYRVAVSGRRESRLEEVVDSLPGEGLAVPCDVTEVATLTQAVDRLIETWGRLDIVVANAGFAVGGPLEELDDTQWRRQLEVNVVGAASTVNCALPHLKETRGRIGLVASVASMVYAPGSGAYNASKAALRAMGLTLSLELHGTGVSCTTLHPGFVESEIGQVDNSGQFHAEWKDQRPAALMWTAPNAAKVMVRAIEKRKREYVFTWHGRFGAFMGRHFPGCTHWLIVFGKRFFSR
jgi:NAD(P)-dependent dehydrogenase (short-subunit alcohol dehydrogenase family)